MSKLSRTDPAELAKNPRATLAAWLRYEPIVVGAIRLHPKQYVYAPSNLSPSTVASRLRDAVRGKIAFDYKTSVATSDVARWWDETAIRYDNKNVYIGPPESVAEALRGTSNEHKYSYETLTFEEISAFAILLSNGRISGPVVIQNPPDVSLLNRPNVELIARPDGSLYII